VARAVSRKRIGHGAAAADGVEVGAFHGVKELELLGVAADDPGGAARPRGERRVALLRARAAELAVVAVEDGLVGDAAADVVAVAPLAEEDVEARGGGGVLDGAVEQVDRLVALAHQHVAELVRDDERAHGADRVGEERLRAVEGVDVAAGGDAGGAGDGRPWGCLTLVVA
jgi:hypothetical protein